MAEEQANKLLKNSFLENVNKKSDHTLTKLFKDEYSRLIENAKQDCQNLYLTDVLEKLHFIDDEILKVPNFNQVKDRYKKLKVLLRSQNNNLLIISSQTDYPEDIEKNLFKVLCAILNLKPFQKGEYVMD